ncbi:MAG TPA: GlsB/YeaQ/YmgE family stress response membrane protein [Chloroflexota bacterium]|nr:GlsB/YeaQ/YmgE family stress response membrane protein [Chloroflexota bacterium]
MPVILVAVLVVLAIMFFFTITTHLVALLLTLLVAGFIGWLADVIVPGRLPYGWLGAIVAGIAGSWIGSLLFRALGLGDGGFSLFGVPLIPALVGAIILAFVVELLGKQLGGSRALDRRI